MVAKEVRLDLAGREVEAVEVLPPLLAIGLANTSDEMGLRRTTWVSEG